MIKTRFAPSPTGYLHIGGVRTALYCYLFAKHHQGEYILRIEDTDRERSTDEAVDVILDGLSWLGLSADQEPIYQTSRFDRYKEVIQQLLNEGKAYRCYCSRERLDALRESQYANKEKPRYDGHCRDQETSNQTGSYVIRFKNPQSGSVTVDDQVLGQVEVSNEELDDLIIARSDGTPTYNLCVVVDDMDMGISHVIRGNDHLNNTPRQINLFHALGETPPVYAHIPMILGEDGKKLSKRHGAVSVLEYREQGYLPQAILNYLVRLGWSSGDQEIFSMEEMIQLFDLQGLNKSAAAMNHDKLTWLNQHYLKSCGEGIIIDELAWHLDQLDIDCSDGPQLNDVVATLRERVKTIREMAEKAACFYGPLEQYDQEAAEKFLDDESKNILQFMLEQLCALESWDASSIKPLVKQAMKEFDVKMPMVAQPLRVALTGNIHSPAIDATLALVGRDKSLARIQQALDF